MSTFFSSLLTLSVSFCLPFCSSLCPPTLFYSTTIFPLLSSLLSTLSPSSSSFLPLSLLPRVSSSSSSLPLRHKSGNVWYKFVMELLRFPA